MKLNLDSAVFSIYIRIQHEYETTESKRKKIFFFIILVHCTCSRPKAGLGAENLVLSTLNPYC